MFCRNGLFSSAERKSLQCEGMVFEMVENVIIFILFGIGIVLIVKGGDLFVDSASYIAEISGVPKFIIGATIVSLATTMPEMLVSALAAYDSRFLTGVMADEKVLMAIGNAVGSVTCNIGMILAISIIFMPSVIERKKFIPKTVLLILAIVSLTLLSLSGTLTLRKSILLFIIFIIFIAENIKSAKSEMQTVTVRHAAKKGEIAKKLFCSSSARPPSSSAQSCWSIRAAPLRPCWAFQKKLSVLQPLPLVPACLSWLQRFPR